MPTPLEALHARVQARLQQEAKLKEAEKKLKTARFEGERNEANAAAQAIREQMAWTPKAVVLRIEEWTCKCGATGQAPGGLFLYAEHNYLANTTRLYQPPAGELPNLPRKTLVQGKMVALCHQCGPTFGFTRPLRGQF